MKRTYATVVVTVVLIAAFTAIGIFSCDSTGAGPSPDPGGHDPIGDVDLTGYWITTVTLGTDEVFARVLSYLLQTDDFPFNLNGYRMTGNVSGAAVTWVTSAEGQQFNFTGTIQSDGSIAGTMNFYGGEEVSVHMTRVEPQGGSVIIDGLINFETDDRGFGGKNDNYTRYELMFEVQAGAISGRLTFETAGELKPGIYEVVDVYRGLDKQTGEGLVAAWFHGGGGWEDSFESGELNIESYDPTGEVNGTFLLELEGGDYLDGSFQLSQPPQSGGSVTIEDAEWNGEQIQNMTATGLEWSTGSEPAYGDLYLMYVDEDQHVWLELVPEVSVSPGTYSVPDEMDVRAWHGSDIGSDVECDEPVSGEVTLTRYDTEGMAGSLDVTFNGGTLSVEFDVLFEVCGFDPPPK